ncbi:type I restriction enzyme HsdR N-terminal domain-containing protein [Zobellia laminariae]|uniref:type I restriction enzyme HsdR N-terminal domain-containing protein n=1 Tax=Zobellia laminariae TaxID=248906 RepID=UPI0012D921D5|nr:hypothetical protein [Zobellia laminariae]
MNNEKWNEICFLLSTNIKNDISESDFEQNVIQALRVLNWKEFTGDIQIRPSFPIGAANRIMPDFVINSSDKKNLFVIEIKQPSIPLNTKFQQQLFSYMRQLKLQYGILIGQVIQVFYDGDLTNHEDPVLLETIDFSTENLKGHKFVELFSKENFSDDLLQSFTLNSLKKINRKEDQKTLFQKITSTAYKAAILELIKQDFLNKYDAELIENVLKNISIDITSKDQKEIERQKFRIVQSSQLKKIKNNLNEPNGKLPIGKYVRQSFGELVKDNLIDRNEIERLQRSDYSKLTFDIQFPFMVKEDSAQYERLRYWKNPYYINGQMFFVCSQWYEVPANNDRPYYEEWLRKIKRN